jgi:hypothetical protein
MKTYRVQTWLCRISFGLLLSMAVQAARGETSAASLLFRRPGTDASFADLLAGGVVTAGQRFFAGPVTGSLIAVNHVLLEQQVDKPGPIPKDIGLHTQASGGISRKDFAKWTRWYREDGNVQVFRLFKGEQNFRDGTGAAGSPGRVEAYSKMLVVEPGTWCEWEGTYTIVEPVGACIFQLMHAGSLWPMHIDMTAAGEVHFLRRREAPGLERTVSLAKDLAGKSIRVKVRANGTAFEVYQKDPLDDGPWTLVTKGVGPKAEDNNIQFRWGLYCGSKKGQTVAKGALLFVTGVIIR